MTAARMSRARRFARCLKVVALCTLATIYAPSEAAREQSIRFGDIDAVVWTPDVNSDKPLPVVVFSHGLYTCATQSRFITEALADSGYFVVAVPAVRGTATSQGAGHVPGRSIRSRVHGPDARRV